MNASEFAQLWRENAEQFYDMYVNESGDTAVYKLIAKLNLEPEKYALLDKLIKTILQDTHYCFLMTLDGCYNLAGVQQNYKLYDEEGQLIFQPGDLEPEAYEEIQEKLFKDV